jgi:hypothetical protein
MAMNYEEFLDQLINKGIDGVEKHYPNEEQSHKREGSIAGFEACRGKNPVQLKQLLIEAGEERETARQRRAKDYWHYRYKEVQIEFVCNAVSVCLVNQGQTPIIPPTARGMMAAANVVGVADK